MKHLLSIEWLKLRNYRTFWILTGFFALLLPLWNYGISNGIMKFGGGGKGGLNIFSQAYAFSNVWQNLGFWASIFVVFISILTIIITTNEYQFRTNRQNVIDGWSRLEFFHAKCLLVLSLSLLTTLYVFIVGTVFGAIYGDIGFFPGHIEYLFYVFVLSLNYYGFAFVLALFFKRSGIAIGMFFLYSMILEAMIGKFVNWQTDGYAGNFMPLQCSDELLPFPVMDMVKSMIQNGSAAPSATWYLVASFAWITIYYIVGRQKLLRSDW
ncbi:MAG TPA: ABC transporter permease [Flavipsychrobacter sp.]|nr:ABC transporter permease [Flavipsychrobacter sp.]